MDYGYQLINGYDTSALLRGYANSSALSSGDLSEGLFVALAGFFGVMMFFVLVIAVLQIVGMWKVFTKAGEKGWKSIIPFYNIAILYKISGMSPYLVFVYIALFIPLLNFIAAIAIAIFDLYQRINLMKAFKSSTGLTVAMLMVPFITYLILGFGKATYYGFDEAKKSESTAE